MIFELNYLSRNHFLLKSQCTIDFHFFYSYFLPLIWCFRCCFHIRAGRTETKRSSRIIHNLAYVRNLIPSIHREWAHECTNQIIRIGYIALIGSRSTHLNAKISFPPTSAYSQFAYPGYVGENTETNSTEMNVEIDVAILCGQSMR